MEIITPKNEFDLLGSRSPIDIKCLNCSKIFQRNKHRVQDYLKRGEMSGAFCSNTCSGEYKTKKSSIYTQCKFCHAQVIRKISDLNKSDNYFCNSKCSSSYFAQFIKIKPIKLICQNCKNEFERKPCDITKTNKNHFCSRKCSMSYKDAKPPVMTKCDNCKKDIKKYASSFNAYKHHFCNKSCQAIFANKTYNRASRFGINRSKAELLMISIIRNDFPNLNIIENDRKLLNGLELDLYIPDKNIGIELNGPCHYIPIFGQEELSKTQNKDLIKKQKMQELKIHFFQINIMGAGKKLSDILNNSYNKYIKPLLV